MIISRKVISQAFTTFVMGAVAYVATHQGWHVSPDTSVEISAMAAWLGGIVAGYMAKEDPRLFGPVGDAPAVLPPGMTPTAPAPPVAPVEPPTAV